MSILRDISEARSEFRKTHGEYPKRLVTCPCTLDKIKLGLYKNSPLDPKDIPLSKYDGMTIEIKKNNNGWSLSGT